MEIKVFKSNSMYVLESDINKFIHGMSYDSLKDIKLTTTIMDAGTNEFVAMVIYREYQ